MIATLFILLAVFCLLERPIMSAYDDWKFRRATGMTKAKMKAFDLAMNDDHHDYMNRRFK